MPTGKPRWTIEQKAEILKKLAARPKGQTKTAFYKVLGISHAVASHWPEQVAAAEGKHQKNDSAAKKGRPKGSKNGVTIHSPKVRDSRDTAIKLLDQFYAAAVKEHAGKKPPESFHVAMLAYYALTGAANQ